MDKRLEHEIEHGKKLLAGGAEDIWNWASPSGRRRADRRAELLIKTAKIVKNDYVLEIGCGTGLFTKKIYNATNAHIIGTDLSEELLEEARRQSPQGTFCIENAMNLSYNERTFDVVYGSSILHHLDFNTALDEIYRVLKKGGRMVFAEPNMINPQILIQKNIPFIKKWLGDSPDETAIIRWNFAKLMQSKGFTNVHIKPYDFLHPITPEPLIGLVNTIGQTLEKIPLLREIAGSVIIYGEKS